MIKLKNAEFHSPFMVGGKNFPTKVNGNDGVELFYLPEKDRVFVRYKGSVKQFQSYHNIEAAEPKAIFDYKDPEKKPAQAAPIKVKGTQGE